MHSDLANVALALLFIYLNVNIQPPHFIGAKSSLAS